VRSYPQPVFADLRSITAVFAFARHPAPPRSKSSRILPDHFAQQFCIRGIAFRPTGIKRLPVLRQGLWIDWIDHNEVRAHQCIDQPSTCLFQYDPLLALHHSGFAVDAPIPATILRCAGPRNCRCRLSPRCTPTPCGLHRPQSTPIHATICSSSFISALFLQHHRKNLHSL
jgi:hypothetical protein